MNSKKPLCFMIGEDYFFFHVLGKKLSNRLNLKVKYFNQINSCLHHMGENPDVLLIGCADHSCKDEINCLLEAYFIMKEAVADTKVILIANENEQEVLMEKIFSEPENIDYLFKSKYVDKSVEQLLIEYQFLDSKISDEGYIQGSF